MRNKEVECPKEKWLVVNYSPLDDKPEYRQPILCRAKDIGKIVYGMWIIGDKQYGKFQDDSRSDNEEKFYTAYKLVKEMFIHSNFELDKSGTPFIVKIGSPSADTITEPAWEYFVAPFTDDYRPRYEPNYAARNGMIYIKMPSGMDAKQTDDAAEEKFAGRPQIQKGDIVRFISALTGEENVEVVRCENTEVYFRRHAAWVQLTSNLKSAAFCPKTAFFAPKTVIFGGLRGRLETYRNLKLKCKSEALQKSKAKFKRISNFL